MMMMLSGAQYCPIIVFNDDNFDEGDEDKDNDDDVIRGSILSYYWRSSRLHTATSSMPATIALSMMMMVVMVMMMMTTMMMMMHTATSVPVFTARSMMTILIKIRI